MMSWSQELIVTDFEVEANYFLTLTKLSLCFYFENDLILWDTSQIPCIYNFVPPCHRPLQGDLEDQLDQGDQRDLGFHHGRRGPWDLSLPKHDIDNNRKAVSHRHIIAVLNFTKSHRSVWQDESWTGKKNSLGLLFLQLDQGVLGGRCVLSDQWDLRGQQHLSLQENPVTKEQRPITHSRIMRQLSRKVNFLQWGNSKEQMKATGNMFGLSWTMKSLNSLKRLL